MAYLQGVEIAPTQSVESTARANLSAESGAMNDALFEELGGECAAAVCGLTQGEVNQILLCAGTAQNYGLPAGESATRRQQTAFFRNLRLADLVLAQACAQGNERAWERFIALYQQPLIRAAIAITGGETLGRELADSLYAELYGLTTRDGERRCPLDSYKGKGSLIGWLRTTLAQRYVDHHRRSHRELALDDPLNSYDPPATDSEPEKLPAELQILGWAIEETMRRLPADDRFLLASYYIDERTLLQIAQVLHVHEATVSRKLRRVTGEIRKQVLKSLQSSGLSRRAAEEALGADPRDLDLNLKKMLQNPPSDAFQEKAAR